MAFAGPNPLEILLLMLLGGGYGLPSGVPPAAEDSLSQKIAPAECLFYTSWAATGQPDAGSGNHTERMLAEPDVQDFLNNAGDAFLAAMQQAQQDPNAQKAFGDIKKAMKLIRGKAGAFYLSELQINGPNDVTIKGGGLMRTDADGPALKQILENFQSQAKEGDVTEVKIGARTFYRVIANEEAPPITWGLAGRYFIFGLGDGAVEDLMRRARGQQPAWLTSAKTKLAVPRISSVMYVDAKKIIDMVVTASGEPEAQRLVSALGFDNLGTVVMVNGLDDTGCVMRGELSIEGAPKGILSLLDAQPLNGQDLALMDKDSPVALAFKLDGAKVLDLILDISAQMGGRGSDDLAEGLEMMRQQTGIDLREDVLASLSDTWRVYAQPGPAGLITGWTVAIKVRNRRKLEQVQDTVTTMAKGALQQAGPGSPTLESSEIAGYTVHTVSLGQPGLAVAPSWCITDDELFVAMTPEQLQPLIAGNAASPSLAQNDDVKQLFQADSRTLAFAYLDTQEVAKTLLPFAQMGLQMMAGQPGTPPMTTDGLPPKDAIVPHLQPSLFAVQRTAVGVGFTSHQTLPGGNVGASAPVMVALLLPAVQASREAARRMQGSNNLKQIGLAMHNFHDTYSAFPAGFSADADGKPLLSWRVHILPFIEQGPLYQEFHLDEPWDSPHNKTLIEKMPVQYLCPNSNAGPGMTNYVGLAGKDGIFVLPAAGDRLGTRMREVLDGTSNTMMTVEVPDASAVIWTKPADFSPNVDQPTKGLIGLRPGGFQAGFTDGSVRFIAETIDVGVLKALFTKSGGEPVPNF